MPSFLHMSSTFTPASACLSALTICSSVYLLFRMSPILHGWAHVSPGPLSGGKVTPLPPRERYSRTPSTRLRARTAPSPRTVDRHHSGLVTGRPGAPRHHASRTGDPSRELTPFARHL